MRKFQCLLPALKWSYICYYIICMTVPLMRKSTCYSNSEKPTALIDQLAVQFSYFLNIIFWFSFAVTEYSGGFQNHKLRIRAHCNYVNLSNNVFIFDVFWKKSIYAILPKLFTKNILNMHLSNKISCKWISFH